MDQGRGSRGTGIRGVAVRPHPSGERNRWIVAVRAGWRADGKPNRAHRVFYGTRGQAISFGVGLRQELLGAPAAPGRLTVGRLFEDVWLPHKRAQADRDDRSPTTVDGYASQYRRYVAPFPISRLPLRRLDAPEGTALLLWWFSALAASRPLSPKTLHHALSTMRSALRHALQTGLISRDPFATFPRDAWPRLHRGRPSKRAIGSAGMVAVVEAFRGHELEAAVALAALGLRRGEILGLRIRGGEEDPDAGDLTLEGPEPRLRVRQVVVEVDGGHARVRRFPKSEASVRDLRLPGWAVPVLRAAKRRALEVYLGAGRGDEPQLLLFPSPGRHRNELGRWVGRGRAGDPTHPSVFSRRFRARLREAGVEGLSFEQVERVSPHALRHSFVSALINEAGMRAEDVQQLAGHASLTTTQAYRARDEEPAARAAEALDALLGRGG